jgi:hypothetical protein
MVAGRAAKLTYLRPATPEDSFPDPRTPRIASTVAGVIDEPTYARLRSIKARYDPWSTLRFNHTFQRMVPRSSDGHGSSGDQRDDADRSGHCRATVNRATPPGYGLD